jgi:hypothetical protein
MSFSAELLQAPPEILAKAVSLEVLKLMAVSYVQDRNQRATLNAIDGQADWATRCGASKDEIRSMIRKAFAAPRAHPDRLSELTRLFLQ